MKILFIGLGSIGTRHASIIHKLYPEIELFALRYNPNSETIHFPYIQNLYDWNDVVCNKPDIAFICNPTYLHIETAIKCAIRKMHLFIEKPLCNNFKNIFELMQIIYQNNLTSYVAYPFRFHHEFKFRIDEIRLFVTKNSNVRIDVKTNIEKWGKQSYSFNRKYGGGVLFELSHELDLLTWIFGSVVDYRCNLIKHPKYNIHESARLQLVHENKHVSKLHLSLIDNNELRRFRYNNIEFAYHATEEIYEKQIKYFLNNIGNKYIMNNIFEASKLLDVILKMENKQ